MVRGAAAATCPRCPRLTCCRVLPARYYTKRLTLPGVAGAAMAVIVLDTGPCVSGYRSSDNNRWDPCGASYPTCSIQSPSNPHDQFEGPCHFNKNILTHDCGAQLTWITAQLEKVPKGDWLVVMGHPPIDKVGAADFTTPLLSHGFDLYLNGHAHILAHYSINGNGAFLTSGTGSMVDTPSNSPGSNRTPGQNRAYRKTLGLPLDPAGPAKYEQIRNSKTAALHHAHLLRRPGRADHRLCLVHGQTLHTEREFTKSYLTRVLPRPLGRTRSGRLQTGEKGAPKMYQWKESMMNSGRTRVSPDLSSLGIAVSQDEAAIRLCLRLFARSHGTVAPGVLCLCSCDGAEVIVCRNG